jgi:oligosaccharide repeat unit polymerase
VTLVQTYRGSTVLLLVAAAYASIFIILDGPNIPQLREHLLFLFQESAYTYTEVRRILFADSLVSIVQGYTRQSATALLIAFLAITSLRVRWFWRLWFVAAILVVFATAALQLNKFPLFYFLVCAAVGCYVFKKGFSIDVKGRVALLAGVPILFLLLFGMYVVQYSEQIKSGIVHTDNLVSMVFYRPFMAESDALRLWFEEFPDRTPFLGIRNIDLLADLFGLGFVDVTRLIPVTYINKELTTFQTGFIGSGYASFGYPGIALYGLVVGAIAVAATALINRIREADVKAAFCGVLCLNMYFMFSRELATALLSGGIGPVFAMALLYIAISGRTERRHRYPVPTGPGEKRSVGFAPAAQR